MTNGDRAEYSSRKCGQCLHWHPTQSIDLSVQVGACRAAPPAAQRVGNQVLCNYPILRDGYPACALFDPALATVAAGENA